MDITAVEHIGLAAQDPARLKDWYASTLGAKLIYQTDTIPPAFFLELPGGLVIEIYSCGFAQTATSDNTLAGWRHLALRVDSIEAARAELSQRGVEFSDAIKPAGGGGRVLFFKDSEENLLHLVERPADSVFGKAK